MDWTLVDNIVNDLFFCATQITEEATSRLYKEEWKCPTPVRRQLSWTQAVLGRVILGRVGAGVGDKNAKSNMLVRPLRIPLVIRLVHCTYVVR